VVLALSLSGCRQQDDPGTDGASGSGNRVLTQAVRGLCDARDAIGDSIAPAWRIFQNESHDALHELARRVTEESRVVAARLLEAKQRVEAGFAQGMSPDGFRTQMIDLIEEANAALEEVSMTPVEC
jgi:hypothetical protein